MNRHVPEEVYMANKYMKKYPVSLAVRKMQIKAKLRFHFTPEKMYIFEKSSNNKC